MKTYNLTLTGTLTTLSPLTIVPPNSGEGVKDGGKYKRVALCHIHRDGLRETVPMLPGSTFRGRLRRALFDVVRIGLDMKVTLDEFHLNVIGGVKGSESEGGYDYTLRSKIRNENPILSLFGSGAPWMCGRIQAGHGIPNHPVETDIVGGVRSDDGARDMTFFEKLTEDSVAAWSGKKDDNARRSTAKTDKKNITAALRKARGKNDTETVEKLEKELAAAEQALSSVSGTNSVSMPIMHEAIPAGVEMDHVITLKAVTEEEIGAFLIALHHLWRVEPNFGQKSSYGYGLIDGSYEISIQEVTQGVDVFSLDAGTADVIGTAYVTPFQGVVFSGQADRLRGYIDAFTGRLKAGAYNFGLVGGVAPSAEDGDDDGEEDDAAQAASKASSKKGR